MPLEINTSGVVFGTPPDLCRDSFLLPPDVLYFQIDSRNNDFATCIVVTGANSRIERGAYYIEKTNLPGTPYQLGPQVEMSEGEKGVWISAINGGGPPLCQRFLLWHEDEKVWVIASMRIIVRNGPGDDHVLQVDGGPDKTMSKDEAKNLRWTYLPIELEEKTDEENQTD